MDPIQANFSSIFITDDPCNVVSNQDLRVLCGTLQILGNGHLTGFKQKKGVYIFVDEAGQSPEPDILIPWTQFNLNLKGQVVLAGDPHQLGPVVKSEQAKYLGLELSMMQRLMQDERFQIYQRDSTGKFNENFVIQLTKNYRSHPDLLKIPNELYYKNTLEACASKSNELCHLKLLPQEGFPMIFHSVHSKEHVRPEDSTSLMNIQEISLVLDYVFKLLEVCRYIRYTFFDKFQHF